MRACVFVLLLVGVVQAQPVPGVVVRGSSFSDGASSGRSSGQVLNLSTVTVRQVPVTRPAPSDDFNLPVVQSGPRVALGSFRLD